MQELIKKESGTGKIQRSDRLSLLWSLTLAIAFTFALTLLPYQFMVGLFCLAWITVFVIAITHNPKS